MAVKTVCVCVRVCVCVCVCYLQDAEKLTGTQFMAEVGKILREADFPTKSEIIASLSELFANHTVSRDSVRAAIYSVLTGSDGTLPPNYTQTDDERFVQAVLPLLFTIAKHDKVFLVELMSAYAEGGQDTRYVSAT